MAGARADPTLARELCADVTLGSEWPTMRAVPRAQSGVGDRLVVSLLGAALVAALLLTWRRWGIIDTDTGLELTVAEMVSHGAVAYRDVRYFYGPAGLYSLAVMFKLFGAGMSTAIAFGVLQTLAILATFYALARRWVRPAAAGLASAGLLAIGFSGWANFMMPNTNSATFGLLFVLLLLLALTRGALRLAGVVLGILALTRIEFAAAGAITIAAYTLGLQREAGRDVAYRALARMLPPAIVIAGGVLGVFAAKAGLSRLVTQNLFPVGFLRSEAAAQHDLSPLSLSGFVAAAGRGLVYVALVAGLAGSALCWQRGQRAAQRLRASWPLAVAALGLLLLDGLSRATDTFPGARSLVQTDVKRMLIGMSWLPGLAVALAVWALIRFVRRSRAPLSGSWPLDLALLGCACVLSVRVYDRFTTDTFAPYYAAPLLLLAAIFHQRVGERWPAARRASLGGFAVVVLSLTVALAKGTTAGHTKLVRSARGEFSSTPAAAPALQATIDFLRSHTRPREPILTLPYGGLYFLAGRPPMQYNLAFLPGDVSSAAEQNAVIAALERERVRYAALGNARFVEWGKPEIGTDYDRLLIGFIRRDFRLVATFGDFGDRHAGPLSQAFEIFERRRALTTSSAIPEGQRQESRNLRRFMDR